MLGEWLTDLGVLNKNWWLFGNGGWEYLELGKFWQYLLIAAMVLWIVRECQECCVKKETSPA